MIITFHPVCCAILSNSVAKVRDNLLIALQRSVRIRSLECNILTFDVGD